MDDWTWMEKIIIYEIQTLLLDFSQQKNVTGQKNAAE